MPNEFDLIAKYFTRPTPNTDLGIGDDAALLSISTNNQLVISVDASVVGTHFYPDCPAEFVGWKSLAVNVSDMAAMGATPKWITLAIALPVQDADWLTGFARGFFACAEQFNLDLIGGDTTRGSLNITVQIMGEVLKGKALLRSGAQSGDDVWVSGLLGSAALGLAHLQNKITLPDDVLEVCSNALNQPQPRIALGLGLLGVANSCIDISDGLVGDLAHILQASGVGAELDLDAIPCLPLMKTAMELPVYQQAVLAGGDDYELCFTAPADQRSRIKALGESLALPLTRVGQITAKAGLKVMHHGHVLPLQMRGFDHFA
ncbi:MAG: thiamine-phosphate kinase [Methylophilus sp.]|nr:thiamine-phosphate kinase [Methylophilus sp.]